MVGLRVPAHPHRVRCSTCRHLDREVAEFGDLVVGEVAALVEGLERTVEALGCVGAVVADVDGPRFERLGDVLANLLPRRAVQTHVDDVGAEFVRAVADRLWFMAVRQQSRGRLGV